MVWIAPAALAAYGIYNELTADDPAQGSANPNAYGDVYRPSQIMTDERLNGLANSRQQLEQQIESMRYVADPAVDPMSDFGRKLYSDWLGKKNALISQRDGIDQQISMDGALREDKASLGFGGGAAQGATLRGSMVQQGQQDYGVMAGIGREARQTSAQFAGQMATNGNQAMGAGLGLAQGSGSLAAQTSARAAGAPGTFGDSTDKWRWDASAGRLANFNTGQTDERLGQSYGALSDYAAQGPGPSAAEAQMQAGANANMAAQVSLARSGRGAGSNAMAMRNAAFGAADLGQRNVVDTATLRAREASDWRNQQLQAMGTASGVAGQIDQSQQGRLGIGLNAAQAASGQYGAQYGASIDAQAQAQQSAQNWYQQAGTQQGNQYAQTMGAYDAGQRAIGDAAQTEMGGIQAMASDYQSGMAANAGYMGQYYGTYEAEAARANQLRAASMGQGTAMATANMSNNINQQQLGMQKTDRNIGLVSGALSAYAAS